MVNPPKDNPMANLRKFAAYGSFIFLIMLGACEELDDNNPSPIPDTRDKFTGSWSVNNESCGKNKYLVTIGKDPSNSAQVVITNFAFSSAAEPDTAIVAGNAIVMYSQRNSEGWVVSGSGQYKAGDIIEWNYSLLISGTQESCTATYIRN